jgi:hypothetical protein
LSDDKQFPGFPKDSAKMVIVNTHPDFEPPLLSKVIGDKIF